MSSNTIQNRLTFLRLSENLKNTIRCSWTSAGRPESTAEHTWRLCLMALIFEEQVPDLDISKILKLCIVHDLGEAVNGDIPATSQISLPDKGEMERRDFESLLVSLDEPLKQQLLHLWDDYEHGISTEAKVVKALDKLETVLQHTQGMNPPDFDYGFNLPYGKKYTDAFPFTRELKRIVDEETEKRMSGEVVFRNEEPGDVEAITAIVAGAFSGKEYSSLHEHDLVVTLRRQGQLTLSMVAVKGGMVVGHIGMSPISFSTGELGWYGLAPLSVHANKQRQGIGSKLVRAAIMQMRSRGAWGCVLLGDPNYYQRFGFKLCPTMISTQFPGARFLALPFFDNRVPDGIMAYHESFLKL